MSAPRAKVLRNGELEDIDSNDLVPGDIVLIEAGDYIPADIRLFESANLLHIIKLILASGL
jgi:Ca2+-transporting ATPase